MKYFLFIFPSKLNIFPLWSHLVMTAVQTFVLKGCTRIRTLKRVGLQGKAGYDHIIEMNFC